MTPRSSLSAGREHARVTVVVPHYDTLETLERCLAALDAQTYPRHALEVIVADNGSPQGPEGLQALLAGRARLITVPERGAGPARNGGVEAATGEILAFTDADCLPDPDWVRAGVAALASADFVGGRMIVSLQETGRPTAVEAFEMVFAFDNERYVNHLGFTVTANLFCPRPIFQRVGGFRVGVSEDLDWCVRARAEGFRIGYAADAVVSHPARRTWAELTHKWKRLNAESLGLCAGSTSRTLRWIARALVLPLSALAHTPRVLTSRKLPRLGDRIGALGVLYRLRFWRLGHAAGLLLNRDG